MEYYVSYVILQFSWLCLAEYKATYLFRCCDFSVIPYKTSSQKTVFYSKDLFTDFVNVNFLISDLDNDSAFI